MRAVDEVKAALSEGSGSTVSWLVGEPCFPPPAELVEAFSRAAASPPYGYAPHDGMARLREVLADHHAGQRQSIDPGQIVITSGAKAGLLALFATLLEPGDELIHPLPCYPAYPAMASRLGARPVPVAESGGGFTDWTEAAAKHIGPRTRAVVIASPSNPTGATLETSQVESLVEMCRDRRLKLICDEAYVDFRFAPDRVALPADLDPDRTTVVQLRSVSKSWALCGWRIGWVSADRQLAADVARNHAAFINPASGPAQQALCSLPAVPEEYLHQARSKVGNRISELCSALEDVGASITKPDGGFYLWLDVSPHLESSGASTSLEWCVDIAHRTGVALWPGEDFGAGDHVRIAATAPSDEQWQQSVEALQDVLKAS
jgi:aspartate/methionine/tyrosine aminotransferase